MIVTTAGEVRIGRARLHRQGGHTGCNNAAASVRGLETMGATIVQGARYGTRRVVVCARAVVHQRILLRRCGCILCCLTSHRQIDHIIRKTDVSWCASVVSRWWRSLASCQLARTAAASDRRSTSSAASDGRSRCSNTRVVCSNSPNAVPNCISRSRHVVWLGASEVGGGITQVTTFVGVVRSSALPV